jgi:hypothetical protein
MNEILERENMRLRERLQAFESRQRLAAQALDGIRESLIHVLMTLPIVEATPILGRLDHIIMLLSGEEEVSR